MILKLIGVIFIIVSCGGIGLKLSASYKKEEKYLQNLITILDYMISELEYRHTTLPLLCRRVSEIYEYPITVVFKELSELLDTHKYSNPRKCMKVITDKLSRIPPITKSQLDSLSISLGHFDITGQLNDFLIIRDECNKQLSLLLSNHESRLRGYQTLGLCAGAALVILFI